MKDFRMWFKDFGMWFKDVGMWFSAMSDRIAGHEKYTVFMKCFSVGKYLPTKNKFYLREKLTQIWYIFVSKFDVFFGDSIESNSCDGLRYHRINLKYKAVLEITNFLLLFFIELIVMAKTYILSVFWFEKINVIFIRLLRLVFGKLCSNVHID